MASVRKAHPQNQHAFLLPTRLVPQLTAVVHYYAESLSMSPLHFPEEPLSGRVWGGVNVVVRPVVRGLAGETAVKVRVH